MGSTGSAPVPRLPEEATADVAPVSRRAVPALRPAVGHSRSVRQRARVSIGVPAFAPGRSTQGDCEDRRFAMIRNEAEYQEAVKRLKEEQARHKAHAAELTRMGLKRKEIKRAMDPLRSF